MNNNLIGAISLIVLGINALALAVNRLSVVTIPDMLVRALGICALATLAVFAYTIVKRTQKNK